MEPKVVLFQGDSITDAGRSRENDVNMGYGYADMVSGSLGYQYPYQYKCYNRGISGNRVVDLYASMITAMVLGRVISGVVKSLILSPGTAPFAWVTTTLVTGIPGIIIQLVLMPVVIMALTRARLIPKRY